MASPRPLAPPKMLDTSGLSAQANMDIDDEDDALDGLRQRPLVTAPLPTSATHLTPTIDFAPPVLALAREVLRRADYQLKPPSDPKVNKPLRFEGMTEEQAKLCSPEEMVDRFVDLIGKRQGRASAERLRCALEYVQRQPAIEKPVSATARLAADKASSKKSAPFTVTETPAPAPAATPLPMPGPAANGVVPTPASRLRSASLNAAQRESKVARDTTVQVDRLGPKPQALLGTPIPVGGRAATSCSAPPRTPEHSGVPAPRRAASAGPRVRSPAPSQSTPAHSPHAQRSDDRAANCETVVGASGSRIVRVTSRP